MNQSLRSVLSATTLPIPGVFNALVALAARDAGFRACYISGGATSVCAGVPDIGLLSLDHFCILIREVARASALPVIADADTGFGDEQMTRRTVIEYAHAGASCLHIEDQVFPKRCGHLEGKELIPVEQAAEKIRWAAQAAREVDEERAAGASDRFIVCARTDAAGVEGLDSAIARARAYIDAGAEMIFPEGLQSEQDFETFARAMRDLPGPSARGGPFLLANMTEFGKTPMLPLARFDELGYDCVIYPVSMLRVAMGAVTHALADLHKAGTLEGWLDRMQTRQDLYRLVAYDPKQPWRFPAR